MPTGRFIALYRGINVGGNNPAKMESLRAMHERLGHRDVASFIQSGNIVFAAGAAGGTGGAGKLARAIADEFAAEFGFAARVIVVPADRFGAIIRDNPYPKFSTKDPKRVHVGVCDGKPSAQGLKALLEKTGGTERFVVKSEVVYLHTPDGLGTSKFAAGMEKACGVPMTMRNWRTAEAIWKMVVAHKG